jgi:hypothetical protein
MTWPENAHGKGVFNEQQSIESPQINAPQHPIEAIAPASRRRKQA